MVDIINPETPINQAVKKLVNNDLQIDGKIASQDLSILEMNLLYESGAFARKFRRNVVFDKLSYFKHFRGYSGFSIWYVEISDYTYDPNNKMYVNDVQMKFMGEASNEDIVSFDKVLHWVDASGIYEDITDEAQTEFGEPIEVLEATGNFLYIGSQTTFNSIQINPFTPAEGLDLKVDYWDGSGWVELSVEDGTANLTRIGNISFTKPDNWQQTEVNGNTLYWVRLKTETTPTIAPQLYYIATVSYTHLTLPTKA